MVNAKNVAFKVNKQAPISQGPAQAYGTVLNCRQPAGRKTGREEKEVRSHHVALTNVGGPPKRKRGEEGNDAFDRSTKRSESPATNATALQALNAHRPLLTQHWAQRKPTRLRKGKTLSKGVDLDCWFTILRFSDPAQLLEMRTKIASCYRFLKNNPKLWEHSRKYYYGLDMPDPPSQLTEFQYAHLRHGHGCMSCGAAQTRKTYWAFMRRWCKLCFQSKTLKEHDALALLKDGEGRDISHIYKCLPSGIIDSWGNFVGVGPATTHSLKTIYSLPDVQGLVAEYMAESKKHPDPENMRLWYANWVGEKVKAIEERKAFAKKMELWEETTRTSKTFDYQAKKSARKAFFEEQAARLTPPIAIRIMEACPSYRRAIAIPKEPNMTSWNQLRPKLEKEAADVMAKSSSPLSRLPTAPASGTSTPTSSIGLSVAYMHPLLGIPLDLQLPPPSHNHLF
ncbi:hypothetical protein ACN47E_004710 [Coniothyrium glycines]